MSSVRILAPAKVNLGLAIIGRRHDGYHEIDTIMAMIDVVDEITISESSQTGIAISGMDDVPLESNLMTRAARMWGDEAEIDPAWHIKIEKRIPSPAGIGGGSSDAAAVLRGLNTLYGNPLTDPELQRIAASIGADCPFFLGTPCARATGIGTDLRALPAPTGWLLLAIPKVAGNAKTATLYGLLTPNDFATSDRIDAIEQHLNTSTLPDADFGNSFRNPAPIAFEPLAILAHQLMDVTGQAWLSGSGPALYSLGESRLEVEAWADSLQGVVTDDVTLITAAFLESQPNPEILP